LCKGGCCRQRTSCYLVLMAARVMKAVAAVAAVTAVAAVCSMAVYLEGLQLEVNHSEPRIQGTAEPSSHAARILEAARGQRWTVHTSTASGVGRCTRRRTSWYCQRPVLWCRSLLRV
jgi:hypothetical protein